MKFLLNLTSPNTNSELQLDVMCSEIQRITISDIPNKIVLLKCLSAQDVFPYYLRIFFLNILAKPKNTIDLF